METESLNPEERGQKEFDPEYLGAAPPPDPRVKRWTVEDVEAYVKEHGVYPNLPYNEDPDESVSGDGPAARRDMRRGVARKMKKIARLQSKHGMSVQAAAQVVGYSDRSHHYIANHPEYLKERTRLMAALDERDHRLMDKIARVMLAGMRAKKHIVVKGEPNEKGYRSDETIIVPDMAERRKSAELLAKVTKQLEDNADKRNETAPINFNVLVQMVKEAEKERGL